MQAVLYARFSPRSNSDKCASVEAQIGMLTVEAVKRGYDVAGVFSDKAKSGGTRAGRDGLQGALKAVCSVGGDGCLFVYALDRIARDLRDHLDIRDEVLKCGATIETFNGDSIRTEDDFFVTNIKAVVAEEIRRDNAKKTSDAMQQYQRDGKLMSHPSKCPFGKRVINWDPEKKTGQLVDNPEEMKAMRLMVQWKEQGVSLSEMANRLAAMDIYSRSGTLLSRGAISRIIKRQGAEAP